MAKVEGGDKLAKFLTDIAAKLANAKAVDVGWPENDTYPDGTSVPTIAAIQEFGAPKKGIPPRPYFRAMINKHSSEWPQVIAQAIVDYNYDAKKTLDELGDVMEGQLRQSSAGYRLRRKGLCL